MPSKTKEDTKSSKTKESGKKVQVVDKASTKTSTKTSTKDKSKADKNNESDNSGNESESETPKKVTNKKGSTKETKESAKSSTKDVKDKDTKSTKEKKQFEKVDKGDAPNQATAEAGCYFNVNNVKSWLKGYYMRYPIPVTNKETKVVTQGQVKLTKGVHACLTGTDEVLCSALVNLAGKRAKKNGADLYVITEENMMDSVRMSKELNWTFSKYLDSYDNTHTYNAEMKLSKKDVMAFVEERCLNGNSSVTLDSGAFNFLMFTMHKSRIMLAESAFQMSQCFGRSSVSDKGILFSVRLVFPQGDLQKSVLAKVDNISKRWQHLEIKEKEASEKSEKSGNSDKKGASKKTNKAEKSDKKGGKKTQAKDESDSEESDAEESDASDSGSESEDDGSDDDN